MLRSIALFCLIALFLIVVSVNVYASQRMYDPLMFKLISLDDEEAAGEFLTFIEGTPFYNQQTRYLNGVFDNVFARSVDLKRLNTDKAILEYEKLLTRNPKSRDLLIRLALLYNDDGDHNKAQTYYLRAKAIDPWVDVDILKE